MKNERLSLFKDSARLWSGGHSQLLRQVDGDSTNLDIYWAVALSSDFFKKFDIFLYYTR